MPDLKREAKARLDYWYPKIQGVHTPETILCYWTGDVPLSSLFWAERPPNGFDALVSELRAAADDIGYPVFLRTGLLSGKHAWKRTCYVGGPEAMAQHVVSLTEEQEMALGLPSPEVFAVREMLDLDTRFRAFRGSMPINVEFRVFVDQETVRCVHPYWPAEAFESLPPSQGPDREDWRGELEEMSDPAQVLDAPIRFLSYELISRFEGAWSMDWARDNEGVWYLIDMAPAELSHHADCEEAERWPDPRGELTPEDVVGEEVMDLFRDLT